MALRNNKAQDTAQQDTPAAQTVTPDENAAVIMRGPQWDDDTLLAIDSFDAALALVKEEFGAELVSADETLGNGFTILNKDAKDVLIGLPCIFMSWNFNLGDNGEFVSAQVVARGPGGSTIKAIVNDGSTGIYRQLSEYTRRSNGKQGGMIARRGLTRSDYTYEDPTTGESRPATTYYIDTTA